MADRPAEPLTLETEYRDGVIIVPEEVQAEWAARSVSRVRVTIAGGDAAENTDVETIMQMQHIEREVAEAMLSAAGVFSGKQFEEQVRRVQSAISTL